MPIRSCLALGALSVLAACASVGVGNEGAPHKQHRLSDSATVQAPRRTESLVKALLIQPLPADALTDTVSMAYARRANEFAFYQFASWTERPVRQIPRLLQHRLEARGVAGAVGVIGEPLRADWLLTVAIGTLHHDVSTVPSTGKLSLVAELFDRRSRTRVARRQFDASVAASQADSAAAAAALSQAVAQVFDALVPWLESELQRAAAAPH